MPGYNIPTLDPGDLPINLVPESQEHAKTLTPETPVICMNRSREPLRDTFDSNHYVIPPGPTKFWLPYGAALHFKARLIVPGTRSGPTSYESRICILGIDKDDECVMFDARAEAEFNARPEGLDRAALDPSRRAAKVLAVNEARAGVAGQGAGRRANEVFIGAEAVDAAAVLAPPEGGSVARLEEAAALADGYRPGQLTSETGQVPAVHGQERTEHREDEPPPPPPIRGSQPKGRR